VLDSGVDSLSFASNLEQVIATQSDVDQLPFGVA
jgi:hypothetical protein